MALITRPAAGYTPSNAITNTTKYQDDSNATPRVAISSTKVDGDLNKIFDAATDLSNSFDTMDTRVDNLENPVGSLTDTVITASDVISFADVSAGNVLKRDTVQGILDLVPAATAHTNSGYRSGYYYQSHVASYNAATFSASENRLYALPFFCYKDSTTFDRISIVWGASGSGNARLGIYNMANGIPTTLVADLGTIAYSISAEVALTISQSLSYGQYALAVLLSNASDVARVTNNQNASFYNGNASLATGANPGFYCSQAYGALPGTFGSVTDTTAATQPFIWMRAA